MQSLLLSPPCTSISCDARISLQWQAELRGNEITASYDIAPSAGESQQAYFPVVLLEEMQRMTLRELERDDLA